MSAPQLKTKPSGIHYWEFVDETGARRRVSTNTRDKEKARRLGRDIVMGIAPQTTTVKSQTAAGQLTMRDLFDRASRTVWAPGQVKSQDSVRSNVRIMDKMIGDVPIQEVTYTFLEELIDRMKTERGWSPGTIKRKLDVVSKALRMATIWTDDKGRSLLAAKPPMPPLKVSNTKDRILRAAADAHLLGVQNEEAALFTAIEARRLAEPGRPWFRMAALMRVLLDVGGRLTETLNLGPDDIEFHPVLLPSGEVVQRPVAAFPRYGTKNDKPRMVPITDAAWAAIQSMRDHVGYRKIKAADGVTNVQKLAYFPLLQATVWYMFDNLRGDMAKAGTPIDDVTIHTLRHTCLSRLARGGMDLLRLKEWAGHSDISITAERYAHLIPSNLMEGLMMLGSSNGGTAPIERLDGNTRTNAVVAYPPANRGETPLPLLN